MQFAPGAKVNGTGTFRYSTGAIAGTPTVGATTVKVAWTQTTPLATATVGGAVLSLPAP